MRLSKITGKEYDETSSIYITNMVQNRLYLLNLGPDFLLDILCDSSKRQDCLCFVWKRCQETKDLKQKWDNHEL